MEGKKKRDERKGLVEQWKEGEEETEVEKRETRDRRREKSY